MQVEATIPAVPKEFEPIKLCITLTTKQEAKEFYAMFNHSGITDCVPSIDHNSIRSSLNTCGINSTNGTAYSYIGKTLKERYGPR